MANLKNDCNQEKGNVVDRLVRIVILTIVSFIVSIAAVSFAPLPAIAPAASVSLFNPSRYCANPFRRFSMNTSVPSTRAIS